MYQLRRTIKWSTYNSPHIKFIHSHYTKCRIENNQTIPLEDFRLLKRSLQMCTIVPTRIPRENLHTYAHIRVALRFRPLLNLAFKSINDLEEDQGTGLTRYPTSEPEPNPHNKHVTTNYTPYYSHTRHVVYAGGYSNLLSHKRCLATPRATSLEIQHS